MEIQNYSFNEQCPLCRSREIYRYGLIKYQHEILFSSIPIRLKQSPELWKCRSCYSAFTQNIIPEELASRLYEQGAAGQRWSNQPITSSKLKPVIQCLDEYFLPGKTVLDVGCNTGELLDYAKSRGCVTHGIEYSKDSIDIIRRKGHVSVEEIAKCKIHYDVITLFDVAEHMYDLTGFINQLKKYLAKNGVIIMLTGDIGSFGSRLSGKKWWYLRYPEHIVFPSRQYFRGIPGLRAHRIVSTYASCGYKKNLLISFVRFLAFTLRNKYQGLPSLGPDHMLVVLSCE